MVRFARLRSLETFEHWKKLTSTCSTPSARARARSRASPHAQRRARAKEETHLHVFDAFCPCQSTLARVPACPAPRPSQNSAMARARAYKALPGFDYTLPHTLHTSPELARRRLPVRSESAAAQCLCRRK